MRPASPVRNHPSCKRLGCIFGAVIVSPHHGRPFHENFVLLADAHLHIGHHGAHRAHFPSGSRIAAHGGRSLAQAIAHYNVYAACVQKFHDIVAERRSCCRKYVAIVYSDDTAHGREHFFVEKSVLAFEHPRRFASEARIVKIPAGAHAQGAIHHPACDSGHGTDFILHSRIHLLPETRHGTHARGAHLAQRMLYFARVAVDGHAYAHEQAEICPCLFKNVAERQEAERRVGVA